MTDTSDLPSLSVVIPTYDEPQRLDAALRSLAVQDYPVRGMEIIVVDDASPQFDPEPLAAAVHPFRLKLIRNKANQGRARSRNAGLRNANGELILFLDSDMTVEPDFLRVHASLHKNRGETVIVGNIRFGPQVPHNRMTRYIESRGVQQLAEGEPVPFKCFVTGNSSMRHDLLLQAGLFDEDFTAYGGEDLELGYRLHQRGAVFRYAPDALSWHHHLRSLDQLNQLMYTYGRNSLPLLMQKHPELAGLLRLDFLQASRYAPGRLLLCLALSSAVYQPVRFLTRYGLKRYIPDLFFSYLWWRNRTRGFMDAAG